MEHNCQLKRQQSLLIVAAIVASETFSENDLCHSEQFKQSMEPESLQCRVALQDSPVTSGF